MTQPNQESRFIFPPWTNMLPVLSVGAVVMGVVGAIAGVWFYFSPKHTDVGYAPEQPIPYSHQLHAGEMAMDCRYCHVNVERTLTASVPPTQVCMNCHAQVKKDSPMLAPLRDSWVTGKPVPWLRVHKSPDYVYFDHSRHVTRGVGCVECHGRIDQMVTVRQEQPLSMGWCLECHRDPASHLRPTKDYPDLGLKAVAATQMDWPKTEDLAGRPLEQFRAEIGKQLVEREKIAPPTECSRCHR